MKTLLTSLALFFCFSLLAQQTDIPVQINMKDGTSVDAKHFGRLKCGKNIYSENYIFVKGKYMDSVTEIKDYSKIEKIVLEGFKAEPVASVGNEKAVVRVYRRNGASIALEDAEVYMTCYASGDKYNQIIVQFINPITDEVHVKEISTKDIQSVIFK